MRARVLSLASTARLAIMMTTKILQRLVIMTTLCAQQAPTLWLDLRAVRCVMVGRQIWTMTRQRSARHVLLAPSLTVVQLRALRVLQASSMLIRTHQLNAPNAKLACTVRQRQRRALPAQMARCSH